MWPRFAVYGNPNKAGKARRDTPAGPVRGRVIAQRVRAVVVPVRDSEPIGTALMASLGLSSHTMSPMSNNHGSVSQATGAGITGRDSRRTGPLQDWRAMHGPVARPSRRNVGAQAGPSSQPAYPSTGTSATPSLTNSLAGMGLPQVLRTPVVS